MNFNRFIQSDRKCEHYENDWSLRAMAGAAEVARKEGYEEAFREAYLEGYEQGFREGLAKGIPIGVIRLCESRLGREPSAVEQLIELSEDELKERADSLQRELFG